MPLHDPQAGSDAGAAFRSPAPKTEAGMALLHRLERATPAVLYLHPTVQPRAPNLRASILPALSVVARCFL